MAKIDEVQTHVETGKTKLIEGLVQEALDQGNKPADILDAMVNAMSTVGEKFSAGTIFVPEMLIAAKAIKMLAARNQR